MTAATDLVFAELSDSGGVPVRRLNATRSKRAKSEATRARLCKALRQLINDKPIRAIKVSELTAKAGVSPATFYIYFADIEEAVLALLTDLQKDMPDFAKLARGIREENLAAAVGVLVGRYLEFSEDNSALLRIRNLAADEGDGRFLTVRGSMARALYYTLEEKIIELRPDLPDYPSARAIASVILGSLERVTSIVRTGERSVGRPKQELIDAAVFVICELLSIRERGHPRSMGK